MSASRRSRSRRANTGEVPPLDTATITGSRSMIAGTITREAFAVIDHVDRNAARLAQARDPAVHGAPRRGHDDQPRALQVLGREFAQANLYGAGCGEL